MNAVVKSGKVQLPAVIARAIAQGGAEIFNEIAGGVTAGFPVISYRGKVWRLRKGGHEENVLNEDGEAMPSIEIVLIRSNANPSKIFYEKAYEEGGADAPRCWSADGIRPDSGVQEPVAKNCAACPNNVWGSKITPQGNKTKLCSDARRMAVISRDELEEKGAEATLCLLRVPAASLNPLKDYAEKVLKPKGVPYFAVITRVGFDPNVSYPKLSFRAIRYLSEEEAATIMQLRESEDVKRILAEAAEFDAAGTTEASDGSADADEATAPTPAASSKKKPAKPRPAEEEDVGMEEEIAAPAPAPKKKAAPAPAPVVEEEEEEEEEIAAPPPAPKKKKAAPAPAPVVEEEEEEDEPVIEAPPPPAPKKKKAAPAPAPVVEEEEEDDEPAAAPPPAAKKKSAAPATPAKASKGEDFDSMLDSILNS